MGNSEKSFQLERAQGLSLFSQELVSSPWLCYDKNWLEFSGIKCDTITEGFFTLLRSQEKISTYNISQTRNLGEAMLISALTIVEVPRTPIARLNRLREELNVIEVHAKSILISLRAAQGNFRNYVAAKKEIQEFASSWAQSEGDDVLIFNGEEDKTSASRTSLSCYASLLQREQDAFIEQYDRIGIVEAAALEHEISRIEAVREILSKHSTITDEIDSLQKYLDKLQNAKKAAKKALIDETEEKLEETKTILASFYSGFFILCLPAVIRARQYALQKWTVATTSLHYSCFR